MRRPLELIWQLSFRATTEDSAEDDCAKGNEAKFAKLAEDTILPATALNPVLRVFQDELVYLSIIHPAANNGIEFAI